MKEVLKTASIAAISVVLLKVLLGGITLTLWGQTISIAVIDPGTIAALLGPTLIAYTTSLHDRFEDEDAPHTPKTPST